MLFGALLGNVGIEQHVYKVSNLFCRDAFIKTWNIVADTNEILKSHIEWENHNQTFQYICLLYTSPSPRDRQKSRMPSSA